METTEDKRLKWAQQNAERYARLTPEERAQKREKERLRLRAKRLVETPEEREARQAQYRRENKKRYARLTPEQRLEKSRLEERRVKAKNRAETSEQTEIRRAKYRESTRKATARATPEQLARRRARKMERGRELKAEIFDVLGGECAGCGEKDERVFQVDHVNGGGTDARRHAGGDHYWKVILDHIYAGTDEYQILCANCHMIKSYRSPLGTPGSYGSWPPSVAIAP